MRKLRTKKRKAKIVLIGDFNKDTNSTISMLNRIGIGLRRAAVNNSKGSRMNGSTMGRMIDHISYTGLAVNPNYAKVLRSVDLSDHLPVVAEWNIESLNNPTPPRKIDAAKIKELGINFTNSNRFLVLANLQSNSEELVNSVTTSIWKTAEELNAIKSVKIDSRPVLSKETLITIRKRRNTFKKIINNPSLQNEYSDLKEKVIKLCQQDRRNNRRLEIKKASDLMLGNKSRELWNWIKRVSGRFRSSLTDGPIYNKNKELITETKAKAVAWAAHFEELAKDSTGNSRSPEKWKDIRNNIATFPECDSPLTWKEITEVLKSTPNNKSPGIDGIPSEVWKLTQNEMEPVTPLARLIFRLTKEMWDTERMPEQMDPSIVVPIHKKGDKRDPNNYRGISLIPTLAKIVSKIVARRLCAIDNKHDILAKEQAGFRTREECVAQATALYEVVRRRKISGLSTWIGFIDFAKAYDRVPHEALLRKIKTAGIGGKLYRVIEALYRSPKMCVRVGDRLSKTVEYNCGVRQGCPASPMLFDIYINDLLDGIKGVKIPGTEECIPGLLFADDAVVLAESPAELQIALEKLTAWSHKWEMQINQDKCGIMGINSITGMLFTIMGKPITQVKEYKYLGVVFNNKWNNLSALRNNKENGRKAFQSIIKQEPVWHQSESKKKKNRADKLFGHLLEDANDDKIEYMADPEEISRYLGIQSLEDYKKNFFPDGMSESQTDLLFGKTDRTNLSAEKKTEIEKNSSKTKRIDSSENDKSNEKRKKIKADDMEINALKIQIMEIADIIPSKNFNKELISQVKNFISASKKKLEKIINKKNETAKIETAKTTSKNENETKKISYANVAKKNIQPQKKNPIKKKVVEFTNEQRNIIAAGMSPFEATKYKLLYFDGFKRNRIGLVKSLICQEIQPRFIGNINWTNDEKLEICIESKQIEKLVETMEKIENIKLNSEYNPITNDRTKNELIDRLKWQSSEKNWNQPSRRMARMVTKWKIEDIEEFSEFFLLRK
ncbi:LINE-1 reverse transcriptase-like protein [Smittium culicis]|uniref:LINE-1 reverse transcriptase-like protein n=1 Tax=Smittium culicis TaxID=133412 RepID=A0A1R1YLG2_9FUNG|nr:LINE-1 reverse transcriptase-like protein [Smittium culicis]